MVSDKILRIDTLQAAHLYRDAIFPNFDIRDLNCEAGICHRVGWLIFDVAGNPLDIYPAKIVLHKWVFR